MSAMKLLFTPTARLSLPRMPFPASGTVFLGKRAVLSLQTAAPFRPGCSMNAAGWLLRRSGWPIGGAGCSTARSWTPVRLSGCFITDAGWPIRRSGLLPISRSEHPGPFMEDPAASMAHPGCASDHPATASAHPAADVGAFARTRRPQTRTLASAPTPARQPRTRNSEPRTLPA